MDLEERLEGFARMAVDRIRGESYKISLCSGHLDTIIKDVLRLVLSGVECEKCRVKDKLLTQIIKAATIPLNKEAARHISCEVRELATDALATESRPPKE